MLREILATRQDNPDIKKRWFTDSNMDLYIWLNNETPVNFQLTYNKQDKEHAINWNNNTGFSHNRVDSGETTTHLKYKMSPILLPDGDFDYPITAAKFLQASENIDRAIADFTYARLLEYPEHHGKSPDAEPAPEDL
jgi:hypothetical protein